MNLNLQNGVTEMIDTPKSTEVQTVQGLEQSVVHLKNLTEDQRLLQSRYWGITTDDDLVRCNVCSEPGHLGQSCPQLRCSHCDLSYSHFSSECPAWQKCSRCRERGHEASLCQAKLKRTTVDGLDCDFCTGNHLEENCSWLWRSFDPRKLHGPQLIRADQLPLGCYECGSSTHMGDDCPALPSHKSQRSTNNICSAGFANSFLQSPLKTGRFIRGSATRIASSSKKPSTGSETKGSYSGSGKANVHLAGVKNFSKKRKNYKAVPPPTSLSQGKTKAGKPSNLRKSRQHQGPKGG